jgi:hypothetical protein
MAAPSTVLLEFLTWVACFFVFRFIERRLCRRYPGILSVCRLLYLSTALVAVAPAAWALTSGLRDARLLALVNHVFGMGVFAQTSLRSAPREICQSPSRPIAGPNSGPSAWPATRLRCACSAREPRRPPRPLVRRPAE